MALTPPLIYADLSAARASGGFPFIGVNYDRLALAIASALLSWTQSGGVQMVGGCTGTAGVGTINTPTSRLALVPNPSLVIGGLASSGMVGPLSISLGSVVAQALAKSVTLYGQYSGTVTSVGVGTDASKVTVTNAPSLISLLTASMSSMMGPGPASLQMATGLGSGIAALFLTITGVGTVVGTASTSPATGQSLSVMV